MEVGSPRKSSPKYLSYALDTNIHIKMLIRTKCYTRVRYTLTIEMSKTLFSGGSMHARVKLEGIDGRPPQERGVCGSI